MLSAPKRITAAIAGLVLAATVGGTSATAEASAGAPSASSYLVTNLVGGDHLTGAYGTDYGLTADLAIALASAGDQNAALAKVVGFLRAHVADYADPNGTSAYPGPYTGAVGKLALVAEITGQDPHDFGGFDLLTTLTEHVCTAADSAGACTAAGDFYQAYSTVSQSLAVLALAHAGVTPPASAVSRLQALQCSDGGFSSTLLGPTDTCSSDIDTTSYAAQALNLVPGTATAVGRARDYLLAAQQADGGFIGSAGENSNSTGLGVQALIALAGLQPGAATAADKQTSTGTAAPASSSGTPAVQSGASAHAVPGGTDPVAAGKAFLLGLQTSDGGFQINKSTPGSDVRSTTQAVPALAGAALASVSDPVTAISPISSAPTSAAPSTSAPRTSAPASSVVPSASSAPVSAVSSPAAAVAAASTEPALAATGSASLRQLALAALLIVLGCCALVLGRPAAALARARGRQH